MTPLRRSSAIWSTFAIGIAYPVTSPPLDAAVVIPSTSPCASYVAPPESPEITSLLISISPVSVCPSALPSLCVVICSSRAITSPVAALRWSTVPSASPTAVTASPTTGSVLSVVTVVSPLASASWSTATSSLVSEPTTVAVYVLPVLITVALTVVAPATTWWLVITSPSEVRIMPVPAASPSW